MNLIAIQIYLFCDQYNKLTTSNGIVGDLRTQLNDVCNIEVNNTNNVLPTTKENIMEETDKNENVPFYKNIYFIIGSLVFLAILIILLVILLF